MRTSSSSPPRAARSRRDLPMPPGPVMNRTSGPPVAEAMRGVDPCRAPPHARRNPARGSRSDDLGDRAGVRHSRPLFERARVPRRQRHAVPPSDASLARRAPVTAGGAAMLAHRDARARRPPAADRARPLRGARSTCCSRWSCATRSSLLDLPLVEVVTASLGERARERWDTDTAGELIVLLAAMAELKARRMLGEPGEEEPDPDTLEAREALAARLVAYAPFQRAAAWLAEPARDHAGPAVPARAARGRRAAARRPRGPRGRCATRCARCSPRRRRRRSPTSPTVASACPPRSPACRRRSPGPLGELRRPHATAWSRWRRRSP